MSFLVEGAPFYLSWRCSVHRSLWRSITAINKYRLSDVTFTYHLKIVFYPTCRLRRGEGKVRGGIEVTLLVFRYSIILISFDFILLYEKNYKPTKCVQFRQQWAFKRKLFMQNRKLIPFSLAPNHEKPNAVSPTSISLTVQKLVYLSNFEASGWWGCGGSQDLLQSRLFCICFCVYDSSLEYTRFTPFSDFCFLL